MQVGVDTGGTFTDVVDDRGRLTKVPSTPDDPGAAVRRGVAAIDASTRPERLAHGTTVATNALLERRGARVVLVTTRGLGDVIEIGRQDRPSLYDAFADRPAPLVDRADRVEIGGRLDASGAEIDGLDLAALAAVPDDAEAVAVCLLHVDLDDGHERMVAEQLEAWGLDVSLSADVSPEFREYERTVTTVINAYLRPKCRSYLAALDDVADAVEVMTSGGGLLSAAVAAELPAALLLSGPAGGVGAAAAVAAANGFAGAITFDMGGTSTDVCLVLDGVPAPATAREVGGFPIRFPSLDIHTIGAGGGSIARVDAGGALVVGPESAGARPGPACYGHGGTAPTVTDADVVVGRIPTDSVFGGLRLDVDAARRALDSAGVSAEGVIEVVNANMERALRAVSVERGIDPTELALVAFGGAGPLHACELADALGIATVIVPAAAGVLSAVGLLISPIQRDLVRSWPRPLDHTGLRAARDELEAQVAQMVPGAAVDVSTMLDCRYEGQSHELTVDGLAAFAAEHERRNGYVRPGTPIEVVAIRARARRAATNDLADLVRSRPRPSVAGPSVIAEPDCTIWVPTGWSATPGAAGSLVLTRPR